MITVGFVLPHLRTGGIERGMVTLAPALTSQGVQAQFLLQCAEGALLQEARDVSSVTDLSAPSVLRLARALVRHLREHPMDALYSMTNATNIASLLACRMLGKKAPALMIGEHIPIRAFLASRKHSKLRTLIMKRLYRHAQRLSAPSKPILDEHAALLGVEACPVMGVLPNPVVRHVSPNTPPVKIQAQHIVSIGRLSAEKDFCLAIDAFELLRRTAPDLRLTIFGEGPEQRPLQVKIKELNLTDNVHLAGLTDAPLQVLADADMFLCTSQVEGFGNAMVEAQSVGVPVLSVDCPYGPAEILQGGKAGRLVPSRDPQDIAHAILEFARNHDERSNAQAAGLRAASKFTIEASAKAHAEAFQDLVRSRTC